MANYEAIATRRYLRSISGPLVILIQGSLSSSPELWATVSRVSFPRELFLEIPIQAAMLVEALPSLTQ